MYFYRLIAAIRTAFAQLSLPTALAKRLTWSAERCDKRPSQCGVNKALN